LLQHRSAQLEGFELVKLALVEQNAKVLEEGRGLTWLGRYLLELADRLRGSEDALRSIGSNLK
jgi:hypothetical protein